MGNKVSRLTVGTAKMAWGFSREPALISGFPRWVKDAKIRKDPLSYRQPWWNYEAVAFVSDRLPAGARVFEYGGGASTLWLQDRGATVTTVEDDTEWLEGLLKRIPDADVRLVRGGPTQEYSASASFDEYAHAIDAEPDNSIDLVIVDGRARHDCVLAAAAKVRPGGMLLLDDSQWSDTRPPERGDLNRLRATYADLPSALAGWEPNHLRGIKPGTWLPVQTTVWVKPT